jgi:hypothetical protein
MDGWVELPAESATRACRRRRRWTARTTRCWSTRCAAAGPRRPCRRRTPGSPHLPPRTRVRPRARPRGAPCLQKLQHDEPVCQLAVNGFPFFAGLLPHTAPASQTSWGGPCTDAQTQPTCGLSAQGTPPRPRSCCRRMGWRSTSRRCGACGAGRAGRCGCRARPRAPTRCWPCWSRASKRAPGCCTPWVSSPCLPCGTG